MVTGRTLLPRMKPKGALRVWYINGEDPLEELQTAHRGGNAELWDHGGGYRRSAVRQQRAIAAAGDGDRGSEGGVQMLRPVIDGLIGGACGGCESTCWWSIRSFRRIRFKENDNTGIDMVMSEWIMTADAANCGVEFIHHARKAGVGPIPMQSIDAARGATSLVAKMRSVRALANMTKAQGKQLGLTTIYRFVVPGDGCGVEPGAMGGRRNRVVSARKCRPGKRSRWG